MLDDRWRECDMCRHLTHWAAFYEILYDKGPLYVCHDCLNRHITAETRRGYALERSLKNGVLKRAFHALGYPTAGPLSWVTWQLLNSSIVSESTAREFYTSLGYKPFAGYPLKRR